MNKDIVTEYKRARIALALYLYKADTKRVFDREITNTKWTDLSPFVQEMYLTKADQVIDSVTDEELDHD